ncbi:MGMT family protein [Streptomyces sp. NBC_01335]|uniref:MGMT family protein n=1 Tax=Streptomyces sp. NBC_01335 TaxID=2903828 RepID=UPI002E160FB5
MRQDRTRRHGGTDDGGADDRVDDGEGDRVDDGASRRPSADGGATGAPAAQVPAELPEYAERVLDVADLIPPGHVMTYGDVAEWLGDGGPRQVGRAMALYGSAVPWWRVVRSDGTLLPGHELRALGHYRDEGTPLRGAARSAEGHLPRIDMRRARWDGGTGEPGGSAGPDRGEEAHT